MNTESCLAWIHEQLARYGIGHVPVVFHDHVPRRSDLEPPRLVARMEVDASFAPLRLDVRRTVDDETLLCYAGSLTMPFDARGAVPGADRIESDARLFFQHTVLQEIAHAVLRTADEHASHLWAAAQMGFTTVRATRLPAARCHSCRRWGRTGLRRSHRLPTQAASRAPDTREGGDPSRRASLDRRRRRRSGFRYRVPLKRGHLIRR